MSSPAPNPFSLSTPASPANQPLVTNGKILLHPSHFQEHPNRKPKEKLSEFVGVRVEASTGRVIDELLAVLRQQGSELKTRSDFFRWAGEAAAVWLGEEIAGILAGNPSSSWLSDHIILNKMDQELADIKTINERVSSQLHAIKELSKSHIAAGNYESAAVVMNHLAENAASVKDKVWSATFYHFLNNDAELKNLVKQVRTKGHYVHLLDPEIQAEYEDVEV